MNYLVGDIGNTFIKISILNDNLKIKKTYNLQTKKIYQDTSKKKFLSKLKKKIIWKGPIF